MLLHRRGVVEGVAWRGSGDGARVGTGRVRHSARRAVRLRRAGRMAQLLLAGRVVNLLPPFHRFSCCCPSVNTSSSTVGTFTCISLLITVVCRYYFLNTFFLSAFYIFYSLSYCIVS